MKQLPGPNDNVMVFRSDWGWFWRLIGWAMLGVALLATMGSLLPAPAGPPLPSVPARLGGSPPPAASDADVAAIVDPATASTANGEGHPHPAGTAAVAEQPAGAAAGTPGEADGAPVMAIVLIFALAGWALYRKRIVIDRGADTITIRRGVGLLGWTRHYRITDYQGIGVERRETRSQKSGPKVHYRIVLSGPRGSLTLHEFVLDRLFDSSSEAAGFRGTVAAFCGYDDGPAHPATEMEELERLERETRST